MATLRLNDRRVDALKPRKSAYDICDRDLKGFGVRVLPSGAKRYFIHSQHKGRRVWKIVGHAGAIGADEARERARTLLAAIRKGNEDEAAAPPDTPFETVADEVFRRYARNWKPLTLSVNRGYYRNQILPWFEGRPIGDITTQDVRHWIASLHDTPVATDRSAPILSVIMRQAEVYGYRPEDTNPCAGIKRYRRQGRERFLSAAEIRRLGEVLTSHEAGRPQAAPIGTEPVRRSTTLARQRRIAQHLLHRPPVDAEPPRCFPVAQTPIDNRLTNFTPYIPRPSLQQTKGHGWRNLGPPRPDQSAVTCGTLSGRR